MTKTNTSSKWAFITGSSSGIGWSLAQSLAQAGHSIVLHGLETQEHLQKIVQSLQTEFKVSVECVSADLSQESDLQKIIQVLEQKKIAPSILINNAGFQHVAPIESFPVTIWKKMLDVHLTAPFFFAQHFLPSMRKNKCGRIINVASVHGLVASAQKSAYVSAKHGLIGLTKTLALETAGQGITANAICPGWVQTPLVEKQILDRAQKEGVSVDTAREKLLGEKQPSREFVKTSDLAGLVLFLCSEAGQSMTGSTLTMDGGWTAQ
jgi:3-hydroxybutyrate dehydrogenase